MWPHTPILSTNLERLDCFWGYLEVGWFRSVPEVTPWSVLLLFRDLSRHECCAFIPRWISRTLPENRKIMFWLRNRSGRIRIDSPVTKVATILFCCLHSHLADFYGILIWQNKLIFDHHCLAQSIQHLGLGLSAHAGRQVQTFCTPRETSTLLDRNVIVVLEGART